MKNLAGLETGHNIEIGRHSEIIGAYVYMEVPHRKFWAARFSRSVYWAQYGKVGQTGRVMEKKLGGGAMAYLESKIREKKAKGYVFTRPEQPPLIFQYQDTPALPTRKLDFRWEANGVSPQEIARATSDLIAALNLNSAEGCDVSLRLNAQKAPTAWFRDEATNEEVAFGYDPGPNSYTGEHDWLKRDGSGTGHVHVNWSCRLAVLVETFFVLLKNKTPRMKVKVNERTLTTVYERPEYLDDLWVNDPAVLLYLDILPYVQRHTEASLAPGEIIVNANNGVFW